MTTHTRILSALSLALILSAAANAQNRRPLLATSPTVPPRLLAEMEAILSSCGEIDAPDAAKYGALHRTLTAGKSSKQLDALEQTAIYRETLSAVKAAVHGMPHNDALQLCRATISSETHS